MPSSPPGKTKEQTQGSLFQLQTPHLCKRASPTAWGSPGDDFLGHLIHPSEFSLVAWKEGSLHPSRGGRPACSSLDEASLAFLMSALLSVGAWHLNHITVTFTTSPAYKQGLRVTIRKKQARTGAKVCLTLSQGKEGGGTQPHGSHSASLQASFPESWNMFHRIKQVT